MAKRDPDKLPKGTENELRLLLRRLDELSAASVYISRSQYLTLSLVIGYLSSHQIESGKP